METVATLLILIFIELTLAAAVCIAAGVCSVFGLTFTKTLSKGLWLLAVPPVLTLYGALFGRNCYKTVHIEIISEDIPESFNGYRIVQISDLHLRSFASRHRSLSRAVGIINGLRPDMIAMTGDLITLSPSEITGCDTVLSRLKAGDGIFSVLGNHDYCIYGGKGRNTAENVQQVISAEKKLGWKILLNSHADIARGSDTISIIGVENTSASDRFPSYGNMGKAMEGANGGFKILLSHDPTHWRKEVAGKADIGLTLSGHTHAMQMSFWGWSPSSFIYKEYSGLYTCNPLNNNLENTLVNYNNKNISKNIRNKKGTAGNNRQYLYVNIGLGETGFPARIGARPEITIITLRSSKQEHDA